MLEVIFLCGIFGFALNQKMSVDEAIRVLGELEVHRYPEESKPVGGYGAGFAVINDEGKVILQKTGRVSAISPVECLYETVRVKDVNVFVGHVRMPSEEFMNTTKFKETAQPYIAKCHSDLVVVSVHNGYVTNYREIREELGKKHFLESEKVGLVDSEVIPHLFEELIEECGNAEKALDMVFQCLEGSNTVCLLHVGKENMFMHFIHKGKTRGLNVWTNNQNEIVFCSREEALTLKFRELLVKGKFKTEISIKWREEKSVKVSLHVCSVVKG
jgi:glucosamine 6-phosphate synthetase-like amidotransferase/phosphosugar isomerase protein